MAVASHLRAEDQQPAQQVAAIGNDRVLWLVVGKWQPDQRLFLQQLAYIDGTSTRIHRMANVPPQQGQVERRAIVDQSLHVFFRNGAHKSYSPAGDRREIPLPDNSIPRAVAGEREGRQPRLWAVVDAGTAEEVEARALREQSTQPSPSAQMTAAGSGETPAAERRRPQQTIHLVQYTGTLWQPGFMAPAASADNQRMWLCLVGRQHHLFWQKNLDDRDVFHVWYDEQRDQWIDGEPLRLSSSPRSAFAGVVNTELVFSGLMPLPNDPKTLRSESFAWRRPSAEDRDGWDRLPAPTDEQQRELKLPSAAAVVSAFKEQLVFLHVDGDQAKVGFWSTAGGPPVQSFREVPVDWTEQNSPEHRDFQQFASMLIVAGLMILVFWRRQESITNPVALPAGLVVASPARRALAAIIDMAPAAALITWIYYTPLRTLYEESRNVSTPEEVQNLPGVESLLWAWVWFELLYTLYCTLFELFLAATPGKKLLGCLVLSETLDRPNSVQTLIRNLTRLVELVPYLQIWPFILIIFFTRNRQRIGDLLARTIVVEQHASPAESPPPRDEKQDD